jgi:hypothetical protein
MAIRYADGRHTYAPSMVRDAIRDFKEIYPDWKPKHDITIKKPSDDKIEGMSFASDYLWDLFESKTKIGFLPGGVGLQIRGVIIHDL